MSSPPPSTTDGASRLGQVISGRYQIRELLGEGGMGAVYLAEHTHMRKRVALKLLHPEMKENQEVLERFRREAEAASRIEHPNVAAATDFGQTDDGGFFLVLEYVDGTSLRKAIDQGPMPPARAVHIARQIGSALERAHDAGVVHRDLKPENVMLVRKEDDTDYVKVLDFGIAKVEGAGRESGKQPLTKLGTLLGTPEYMAPEQALGETVGPSADLYALGVMFYEMLTGKHPFDASDRMAVLSMHIVAPIPPMRDRTPGCDVPPALEATIRKLLEKDPKARHASAHAFLEDLDAAAKASGIATATPQPPLSSRQSMPNVVPPSQRDVDVYAKTTYGTPAPGNAALAIARSRAEILLRKIEPIAQRAVDEVMKLPLRVRIGAGVALLLLGVLFTVAVARCGSSSSTGAKADASGSTSAAPPPRSWFKPKSASEEQLREASSKGSAALVELQKEFPNDPLVAKQLALAYHDERKTEAALSAVATAVELDTETADDALVGIVVAATASRENADKAFALLEGPLGARGVDALVDLTTKGTPAVRARANESLSKRDVRAKASPAALVYLDFRAAKTCADKRDLLDRVKSDGDARLLPTLKQLKNKNNCGFMRMRDCWACLRKDGALDEAYDAVLSRSDGAKK